MLVGKKNWEYLMFENKYLANESEKKIQQFWENEAIYSFKKNDNKPVFSIDTPPPTVSGSLHIGHVFSYLHADFIARYKRMTGHNVYYPMGFDDNGLPTEKFVEKQIGKRSVELERTEFINLCLKECEKAEEQFKQLWKNIGLSIDWNYCYSTISSLARTVSQKSFLNLLKKGLIYRKKEPSLFCTDFRSTVSQAELETVSKESFFNTILFELENGEKIQIATTRPEMLPACVAIFVNPAGKHKNLIGKTAKVPLFGQSVKILGDDAVLEDKGTGIVMCCTFGDQQDVAWFKKHQLRLIEIIGQDGKMKENTLFLSNLKILAARELMIKKLEDAGLLIDKKKINHDVHVYERSKKEIEFIVLSQWFIKTVDFKKELLAAGEKINWNPKFMFFRYKDWVENLTWDWCISRQRFFGIPFPVWHCANCSEILPAPENLLPLDPQETKCPFERCQKCSSENLLPDCDVMDTWATSGSTPQIHAKMLSLDETEFLPMNMRPQAHDIIRTWAFDSIVKAHHENNLLPWNDIVISGHVLANAGNKISKSAGNNKVDPEMLLQKFPADAIRFWASKGRLGTDTAFSEDQLKTGNRLLTKLWNAMKFCKESINPSFQQNSQIKNDALSNWVLVKFEECSKNYHKHFENYDYTSALETIDTFFWHIFCDNYLEIVKDQVWNNSKYPSETVQIYSQTLSFLSLEILKMYAPFIPFLTEQLYQGMFAQNKTIHQEQFNKNFSPHDLSRDHAKEFEIILNILTSVRKLKSEKNLSLKTEIKILKIFSDKNLRVFQDETAILLLLGATKALQCVFLPIKNQEESLVEVDGEWFANILIK